MIAKFLCFVGLHWWCDATYMRQCTFCPRHQWLGTDLRWHDKPKESVAGLIARLEREELKDKP